METQPEPKKPVIITGSIAGEVPILASAKPNTADPLPPSPPPTSIDDGSTKPRSIAEALSLLQTNSFDLRCLGCRVSVLAKEDRLYIIVTLPSNTGKLGMQGGHITLDDVPVSDIETPRGEKNA